MPVKPETVKPDPMTPVTRTEPASVPAMPQVAQAPAPPGACRLRRQPLQYLRLRPHRHCARRLSRRRPPVAPGSSRSTSRTRTSSTSSASSPPRAASNVVISEDVKGKMSITLSNVPWDLALDTVLETKGLRKLERTASCGSSPGSAGQGARAKFKLEESRRSRPRPRSGPRGRRPSSRSRRRSARRSPRQRGGRRAGARGPLQRRDHPALVRRPGGSGQDPRGNPRTRPRAAPGSDRRRPAGPDAADRRRRRSRHSTAPADAGQLPPPPPSAEGAWPRASRFGLHKPTNSLFIRHYDADLERHQVADPREARHPAPAGEDRGADGDSRSR